MKVPWGVLQLSGVYGDPVFKPKRLLARGLHASTPGSARDQRLNPEP